MEILIFFIGALFTLTYFIRVICEDNMNIAYAVLGGLVSGGYILMLVYKIMKLLIYVPSVDKYSLIPTYLLIHIAIFAIIVFIISYLGILIYQIYINCKENFIVNIFNDSIKVLKKVIYKHDGLTSIIRKINMILNPCRRSEDKFNINISRVIKLIMIISYLVSGIFLLSYFTNLMESRGVSFEIEALKRDYELYKTVFVTSLIPFTINYIKDFNKV